MRKIPKYTTKSLPNVESVSPRIVPTVARFTVGGGGPHNGTGGEYGIMDGGGIGGGADWAAPSWSELPQFGHASSPPVFSVPHFAQKRATPTERLRRTGWGADSRRFRLARWSTMG